MLHSALQFLTVELNNYLKLRTGASGVERVYLTSVASESGGVIIPAKSLGLSLINIEEERTFKEQRSTFLNEQGLAEQMNPEIKLNLYFLISANFQNQDVNESSDDYVEGLKQLSYAIGFFQSRNVFTPDNSPEMQAVDVNLQKLVVELYSYSFEQLYNFWSVVGTKYLPSVLYRVRVVTFQEGAVKGSQLPVEQYTVNARNK